ncbi:hypothetical protein D3C87_971040 [compost metagenome]
MGEVRGLAQGAGEGVTVHFGHLDVGDDQVDLLRRALQVEQAVDGFLGAACGMALQAEVAQSVHRLLQRHLAVVDHQDACVAEHLGVFHGQVGRSHFDLRRGDAVDNLFDIQHLHQRTVHRGHAGDVGTRTARAEGRGLDVGGQAVDDFAHSLNVQALLGAADVGDDQAAAVRVFQRAFADGAAEVDHRQRSTAQGGDAFHVRVRLRQLGQRRAGDDFTDFQQVDRHQLAAAQGK